MSPLPATCLTPISRARLPAGDGIGVAVRESAAFYNEGSSLELASAMKLVLLFVLPLWLPLIAMAQTDPKKLHQIFEEYFEDKLRNYPESATSLGRNEYNDRWTDWSREARDARRGKLREYERRVSAIAAESLTRQDSLSRGLLLHEIRDSFEVEEISTHLTGLNQLFGPHTRIYLTVREMPARTTADYKNILRRLEAVGTYIDQHIVIYREAMAARLQQPALVIELIVRQLDAQAAQSAEETALLAAFRNFPDTFAESDKQRLLKAATAAYNETFLPAWKEFRRFLAEDYLPGARREIGLTTLEDGDKRYASLIRHYTTTDLTARQVHELGLREVERIEKEMLAIAWETGFEGDLAGFAKQLHESPEQRFTSKEDMLVYCRNVAKLVDPELPRFFRRLPRAPVGIRPIAADREAETPSNYQRPAADGSRAGWFNLQAYKPEEEIKFDKAALVLHETNPGHHLQIALQLELDGLPEFRRIFHSTAYTEGWALYAESLGEEMGVYSDATSRFGKLESERFRARRLVVDTGLHAFGWTRERAVEYLGDSAEIDRYISWPGQALAYKIGELKIKELRGRAEAELGVAFDIREFHDVVLRNGALPLQLLEEQVVSYIAELKP